MATKDNVIGLKARIDTLDLKSGVKEISKYVKEADNAFKNATAGMGKWSESTEGLTQKLKQLDKELEAYDAEIQAYQKEIARVSKLDGDRTKQLEALNDKLNKSIRNYKNTEQSISHYNDALSKIEKNNKKAESSLGKLTKKISDQKSKMADLKDAYKSTTLEYGKNSKEAKELEEQIKKLNDELEKEEEQLEKVEDAAEGLTKKTDKATDSTGNFQKGLSGLKSLGAGVAKGLGAIGGAAAGIATAFLATAGATKEYRTNMGKIESGFKTAGLTAEQATETYKKLFSVVADEGRATEATSMIGQLAKSQDDLNKLVNISTGVWATFGDGLPIEGLMEAAMESAKSGKSVGLLSDALNWAGVNEYAFKAALDSCTTEQERQTLIIETLNGLYSEASEEYQQVNKDIIANNKAQADLTDKMAEFGKKAEPIITTIKEGFTKVLDEVLKLAEDVDFEEISKKIEDGFAYFIDEIIPAIVDGFQWILDNKDTLISGIVAIGAGMAAWNLATMITGVVTAVKNLATGVTVLNTAMKANIIGIIVSLIIGLITYIVTLWKTNEDFRNSVINIWNKIKEGIATAIEAVKTKFNEFKEKFNEIKEKAKEVLDNIVEWFKGLPQRISDGFKKIKEVGKNLIEGIWEGMKNAKQWLIDKIKGFTDSVLGGIKKFFGINSPSKETAEMGVYLVEGLEVGMEEELPNLEETTESLADTVLGKIEDGVEDIDKLGESVADGLNKGLAKAESKIKDVEKASTKAVEQVAATIEEIQEPEPEVSEEVRRQQKLGRLTAELDQLKLQETDRANKNARMQELQGELGLSGNLVEQQRQARSKLENEKKAPRSEKNYELIKNLEEFIKLVDEIKDWSQIKDDILEKEWQIRQLGGSVSLSDKIKSSGFARSNSLSDFQIGESQAGKFEMIPSDDLSWLNLEQQEWYKEFANEAEKQTVLSLKQTSETAAAAYINKMIEMRKSHDNTELNRTDFKFDFQKKIEEFFKIDDTSKTERGKKWGFGLQELVSSFETYFAGIGQSISSFINSLSSNWSEKIKKLENDLKKFNELKKEELENYKKQNKEEQDDLKKSLEKGEINQEAYTLKQRELALNLAEETAKVEEQKRIEEEKTLKKKNELAKKQFDAERANSISSAIMNGALAITKAFADLGPIVGAIMAITTGATTVAQIATIASQKFVPAMAKGGIVNKPTMALVGEAGKEAVMPLENNTQWISELAYKLNGIMAKDLGGGLRNSYSNSYNNKNVTNYYNQTINSPKALSRHDIYRNSKNLLSLKGRA